MFGSFDGYLYFVNLTKKNKEWALLKRNPLNHANNEKQNVATILTFDQIKTRTNSFCV